MRKILKTKSATIGVTMGDPSGIGPEIIIKSFKNSLIRDNRIIVIGDYKIMMKAYRILKIKSFDLNRIQNLSECSFNQNTLNILDLDLIKMNQFYPGIVNAISGNVAYECIRKAVAMAMNKDIDAIATAPISKEALNLSGHKYPGHTELLAHLTDTEDYAMLLHDKKLSVAHISTHIPLLEAITKVRKGRIEKVIMLADKAMRLLSMGVPRIAVAGINPHAGENGLFGLEEIQEIIPAVKNMREKGINVEGPFPPDTVFLQAVNGKYDIVVAMYHDQGHIPLKLVGFNTGVNVTLGLPFIRTSVDHGTAFEIAWQGKACENSMVEAIKLSIKLTQT